MTRAPEPASNIAIVLVPPVAANTHRPSLLNSIRLTHAPEPMEMSDISCDVSRFQILTELSPQLAAKSRPSGLKTTDLLPPSQGTSRSTSDPVAGFQIVM